MDGQTYSFDANGNLLRTDTLSNTFDAANRLVSTYRATTTLQVAYNGVGDRVAQTIGATTTTFALDSALALPEVISTSDDNSYLHLPGVIMAESSTGEIRYLLSDGLGSVRQAVDETGAVVAYNEFDPYGNSMENGSEVYGFTGEWWQNEVGLLHLRARWLLPETGTFLSRDPVESEPAYLYVRGNPINWIDPSGLCPEGQDCATYIRSIEERFGVNIDAKFMPKEEIPAMKRFIAYQGRGHWVHEMGSDRVKYSRV
ncbi:MAG: RHS repeat-associated core domain-containing protein [Chloroflexi bacterium]|nr:RHS repeat-associated core domain-containing protein [Chloroflexota bacterium]